VREKKGKVTLKAGSDGWGGGGRGDSKRNETQKGNIGVARKSLCFTGVESEGTRSPLLRKLGERPMSAKDRAWERKNPPLGLVRRKVNYTFHLTVKRPRKPTADPEDPKSRRKVDSPSQPRITRAKGHDRTSRKPGSRGAPRQGGPTEEERFIRFKQ